MKSLKTNTVKYKWKVLAMRKNSPQRETTTTIVDADSYESAKLEASSMLPKDYAPIRVEKMCAVD